MKKTIATLALTTLALASTAHGIASTASSAQSIVESIAFTIAVPVATTAAPTLSTGASTDASIGNYKIILAAQDDAANLIASNGQIRGVALQKALELIRSVNPKLEASDLQLAEGILKVQPMQ
jgi:uncharacterized protein (TIGR02448 family)